MREKNNFFNGNEEVILGIPAYFVKRSKMKKKKERRDFCIQKKG